MRAAPGIWDYPAKDIGLSCAGHRLPARVLLGFGGELVHALVESVDFGVAVAGVGAALPASGLEGVAEADGGGEPSFASASALFPVEVVIDEGSAEVEVEVKAVAEPPGADYAHVGRHVVVLGRFAHVSPSDADVRRDVPDALLVVAEEEVGDVEERVGMEVGGRILLLVEPVSVSALSGNGLPVVVRMVLGGTLGVDPAVFEAHTESGGEPLSECHVEGSADAVAEVALAVVVAEVELCASSCTDEPVSTESLALLLSVAAGRFLVCIALLLRGGGCDGRHKQGGD